MRLGISPRRFLGEEPRTTTRYYYDDAGRLTHTVSAPEPEWDDRNRAVVLTLLDHQGERHTCGRPMSEALHRAGRPDPEYVVGEVECVGCRTIGGYVKRHHAKGVPEHVSLQLYTRAEARAVSAAQQQRG